MKQAELAQETKKPNGNMINEKLEKVVFVAAILLILFITGFNVSAQESGGTSAPQKTETGNKADQNLKSIARVNPSTLAMEMTLPLTAYPGRNGNNLPVGFSYSSKLWRMEPRITWFYLTQGGTKKYLTDIVADFAERTSAGWTSMLMPPRLDETLDIYNQWGKPYSEHLGESIMASLYRENMQSIFEGNFGNAAQLCNYSCERWVRESTPETPNGWRCASLRQNYCIVYGGNGGSTSESPAQFLDRMHYVKRTRVSMPDGSTHEFRKSDAVQGFCAGANNPFNGWNCEQDGEDRTGTFLSVDGSGMKLVRPAANNPDQRIFLYLPNGSQYIFPQNTENIRGHFATEFIDANGNRLSFSRTIDSETNLTINKWTDTLGREIVDPMPHNWDTQKLPTGEVDAELPGLGGAARHFEMEWLPLKPERCEESVDPTCGKVGEAVPGALENQSEKLYYTSPKFCQGNLTTDLTAGEILFPLPGLGFRSCNSFNVDESENVGAVRFNPVVLTKVGLPNGKSYQFKYNRYGEISKIIYPTGSYETFDYAQIVPIAAHQSQIFSQTNRGVVKRNVYNSNHQLEQRWNYSAQVPDPTNPTSPYIVTTIAPHKSDSTVENETGRMKTVQYLARVPKPAPGAQNGNFGFDDPRGGLPYDERTYDENGNLRSRTLTEYIVAAPRAGGNSMAVRDARAKRSVSIIIEGNLALATLNATEYDENGSGDYEYFSHLNVKETKSYPFVVIPKATVESNSLSWTTIDSYFAGVTPSSISQADYMYGTQGEPYKARGIIGLPIKSRVLNPTNTNDILTETQTVFDESSYLVADSGTLSGNLAGTWLNPNTFYRAKPTTTKVWDKDTNTWIQTHTQYDQYGNVRKVWDTSGDASRFVETEYGLTYGCAYPTKVKMPAPDPTNTHGTSEGSEATTGYDFTTGLVVTITDAGDLTTSADDLTTKTEYNDSLLRPTRTYAVNFTAPETQTIYDDTNLIVKTCKQIDETNWDEATTYLDSFGRAIKTQAKDSQGDVFVKTEYDLLGRVKRATNPYRQGDTVYWSKPRYDELGRAVESFAPAVDGQTGASLGITSYSISDVQNFVGIVVTSTDASGRKSRTITNALGQLLRIDEATAVGGTADADLGSPEIPHQPTFYTYSPQGKMVKVQQGKAGDATIQYRYFLYDSLGRLIRVRQPEQEVNTGLNLTDAVTGNNQWTAGFSYDILGNLITTTDAKGTIITNTYDNAGRVKTRTYSDGTIPIVSFYYDGKGLDTPQSPNRAKGKLTRVTNSISETRYTQFDNLGKLTQSEQITDGQTYTSNYEYNFAGALVKEKYPSGRVVQNEFESDGDLSRIYGKANINATERTYANSFTYTADGRIEKLRLGSGLWESAKFNNRLQVTELALGIGINDASRFKLNYEYGELNTDGATVNTAKNIGNIAKQTVSFSSLTNPFVQSFKYDALYRLTEAKETVGTNTTPTWKQTFGYDRFGNRIAFTNETGGQTQTNTNLTHPSIDVSTNRFNQNQGYVYDKNGNLTTDAQNRGFTFNGENKQTEVRDLTIPTSPGNPDVNVIGKYYYDGEGKRVKKVTNSETTVFVYDGIGKLVAEYSTQSPPPNPTTSYTMTDLLDSPRVITNSTGEVISRRDFKPFGEEINSDTSYRTANRKYGTTDNIRQKFTGYQKDTETNLDFAEARMYQNRHARFTAVDPLLASGKSANPQTFNRYVYVMNSPLKNTDPTGLQVGCQPNVEGCNVTVYSWDWLSSFTETYDTVTTDWRMRTNKFGRWGSVTSLQEELRFSQSNQSQPTFGFLLSKGTVTTVETGVETAAQKTSTSILPRVAGVVGRGALTIIGTPLMILTMPQTIQAPTKPRYETQPQSEAEPQTSSTPFSAPIPTPTATPNQIQTVYRVYGGGSSQAGFSWTPIDPRTVRNFRDVAGLPSGNTGEFLVQGVVRTSDIMVVRPALPIAPNRGGLLEYIINPVNVRNQRVTPLVPPL